MHTVDLFVYRGARIATGPRLRPLGCHCAWLARARMPAFHLNIASYSMRVEWACMDYGSFTNLPVLYRCNIRRRDQVACSCQSQRRKTTSLSRDPMSLHQHRYLATSESNLPKGLVTTRGPISPSITNKRNVPQRQPFVSVPSPAAAAAEDPPRQPDPAASTRGTRPNLMLPPLPPRWRNSRCPREYSLALLQGQRSKRRPVTSGCL